MKRPTLGELELEALRFAAERAPITVGEMAAQFGEPRGLARTTILTVMERLRQKGYLARKKMGGVFHYTPQVATGEVMKDLVRAFVENTLAGSLTPFVAYLAESGRVTEQELEALRRLAESLPERTEEVDGRS